MWAGAKWQPGDGPYPEPLDETAGVTQSARPTRADSGRETLVKLSGFERITLLLESARDPTLFVERRMGLGYTLNLGNPWSWVVIIVFVTGIAVPLLLVP